MMIKKILYICNFVYLFFLFLLIIVGFFGILIVFGNFNTFALFCITGLPLLCFNIFIILKDHLNKSRDTCESISIGLFVFGCFMTVVIYLSLYMNGGIASYSNGFDWKTKKPVVIRTITLNTREQEKNITIYERKLGIFLVPIKK